MTDSTIFDTERASRGSRPDPADGPNPGDPGASSGPSRAARAAGRKRRRPGAGHPLRDGLPRGLWRHDGADGAAYRKHVLALLARVGLEGSELGPLAPLVARYGALCVDLDALDAELEAARRAGDGAAVRDARRAAHGVRGHVLALETRIEAAATALPTTPAPPAAGHGERGQWAAAYDEGGS